MIEPHLILGLAGLSGGVLALIILLYWIVVCPSLYRHGARFPTGLMPWRFVRDVRDYKGIKLSNGDFPFYYYLIWILAWTFVCVLLLLAWFAWQHYNDIAVSRRYAP